MTEPSGTSRTDEEHASIVDALRDALRAGTRDGAPLRRKVTDYVRARRSVGLRPEEVVIELKAELARTVESTRYRARATADVADTVSEQVVRLAIEAYFAD